MDTGRINPVYLIAGAGLVLAVIWAANKGAAGVGQTIGAGAVDMVSGILSGIDGALPAPIQPSNPGNVAYQVASLPAKVVTWDSSATLGTGAYDFTHTNGVPNNAVVAWFDSLIGK